MRKLINSVKSTVRNVVNWPMGRNLKFRLHVALVQINNVTFDVARNSLPDFIYSCAEVVTFIVKHAPHLEIKRSKMH